MEITSFHKISSMKGKTSYSLYRITMISFLWLTEFFLSQKSILNDRNSYSKTSHDTTFM